MSLRKRVLLLGAIAGVAVVASCRDITGVEYEQRMQVAADSVDCVGAHGPRRCLSVRELAGGDAWGGWQPFFDWIDGFVHEPGFMYDLLVAKRTIRNPPADGSSVEFRLIRILSKTPPAP
jgi:hypothetical protein